MAGTFTHLVICDIAKRKALIDEISLRQLLNRYSEFLFLGAVSPDLPYLSFNTGSVNWANLFHYEKTNGIAINGYAELKSTWTNTQVTDEIKLVWLLGYVSHLVIDSTIHPIVQAIVGDYAHHQEEHRICEMTQDALTFYDWENFELRYAEFSKRLQFCRESDHFDALMSFWKKHALGTYADKGETPDPKLWFATYNEAIDAAEGASGVVALFRHLGIGTEYLYKTRDEILFAYPERSEKYYNAVKLPTGNIGKFAKEGIERSVANVINAWNKLYAGLTGNIAVSALIRAWDLDTGEEMGSPLREVTYWV